MDRKLLKQNAKNSFKRKWFESAIIALIMSLFAGGASYSVNLNSGNKEPDYEFSIDSFGDIFSLIPSEIFATFVTVFAVISTTLVITGIFLGPIFIVGGNRFFLKIRKGLHTDIGEVTGNFKDGNYWNLVKIFFIRSIKIFLWTLLFIIPGFIKTYEYMLVDYILAVRPDIDSKEAFRLSKKLMDGHKLDAFVLELSFLGWILLSGFTIGILNIVYVNPYMYATLVEFYCYVRAEGIINGIINPMDLPDYETSTPTDFGVNNSFGYNPQQAFNGAFQNPYQQPFNAGFQQQPDNNPFGYQQTPHEQPQQTPFWQESNQPVGNVDTMPNEEPVSEDDPQEVEFTHIENEENE